MNLDLKNRTAIVCGSTQGLGYASAVELSLLGADVVLLARNQSRLQVAVKELPNNGQQPHSFLVADFNNHSEVAEVVNGFVNAGKTAHILVNNTGGPAGGTI